MSDNPFQPPTKTFEPVKAIGNNGSYLGLGIVNQIQVIAILMIVQGVLLLVMSGIFFIYAFGITAMIRSLPPQQGPEFPQEALFWIQLVGSLGGGFILLLSLMHLLSGYWGLQLKGRLFGMTTLILGLTTALTLYCAPTAIGLAVYGLIIYTHHAARRAFELRNDGLSRQAVISQFN